MQLVLEVHFIYLLAPKRNELGQYKAYFTIILSKYFISRKGFSNFDDVDEFEVDLFLIKMLKIVYKLLYCIN